MKYSNHEEVFFFGSRSFLNNIDKLGKYEKDGSINTYRGVEDGLSIIIRSELVLLQYCSSKGFV